MPTEKKEIEKPTQQTIDEVIDPSISKDTFKIGEKEFKIKLLPVSIEKKFARSLSELTSKLNISEGETLLDILTKQIDGKIVAFADLLTDMVLVIANHQDKTITREYIEENLSSKELYDIVYAQLQKQKLIDAIMGFIKGMLKGNPVASQTN